MEITVEFLQSALDSLRREIFSTLRVAMPGQIVSYDESSGLATVQPALRREASGLVLTAPELSEVPVLLPSPDFSVSAGMSCLLIFADFCLDGFLQSGQPVLPPSPRAHDLSDAIALVGYCPAFGV